MQFDKVKTRKQTLSDTVTNVKNDSPVHVVRVEGKCSTDGDVECRNTKFLHQQFQKLFLLFVRSKCGFSEKDLSNESPNNNQTNNKTNRTTKQNESTKNKNSITFIGICNKLLDDLQGHVEVLHKTRDGEVFRICENR